MCPFYFWIFHLALPLYILADFKGNLTKKYRLIKYCKNGDDGAPRHTVRWGLAVVYSGVKMFPKHWQRFQIPKACRIWERYWMIEVSISISIPASDIVSAYMPITISIPASEIISAYMLRWRFDIQALLQSSGKLFIFFQLWFTVCQTYDKMNN